MANILEVLFLIFGWVYHVKGLVIASLVISIIFLALVLLGDVMKWSEEHKGFTLGKLIVITCIALSIIKLCIW